MEHSKRSNLISGIKKIQSRNRKRLSKLRKQKNRLDRYVKLRLEKKKITRAVELNRINKALKLAKKEIKIVTLDSGVRVRINARDKSIFIINENSDSIALPEGSYDFKDNLIRVSPDGVISNISPKPFDALSPKINNLKKHKFLSV